MAETKTLRARPLSPHLQVYRMTTTMLMSIVHRITGVALYFGALLVVWWLVAAASGPEAFATAQAFFGSWFGRLVLFGYTWALFHHMLGGVRHLIWDTGAGLDHSGREFLTLFGLVGGIALTIIVWVAGYMLRGAF